MSKIVDIVTDLTQDMIQSEGFELFDLEFVKEGKNWFLRFALDKPGGIDLEDCAYMSEKISAIMDAQEPDPIPQAYFLEVSSPGAERALKTEEDLVAAIGKYIHLSFYKAIDGEKFIEGTLKELDEENITLEVKIKTRRKMVTINRKDVAKARLAIEF
ncbi:ribosome maturation factor RimP [Granulicatella balaenopterae]|uniref:Ribosome maturation factor RimP n=1 Tax=Granulicatella balaenopterae TaxID=137733 RepID=A0A1H9L659_9LACT|nr:ribosome maturation factor RimP [Granulicatella balaenopterae]SER06645.1 ribosome maturation factor RimP [Granulicatella balaenopterae]